MPANTDCLQGLTGLTRAGSQCFPLPVPAEGATNDAYTTSASGLYVDEVEGLTLRPATATTPASDVWQRLDMARNQALNTVAHRLGTRGTADAPRFTLAGQIGGEGKGQYAPAGMPSRMYLKTKHRPGGALKLLNLRLLTDVAVSDVPVLLDGVQVATVTTNAPGPQALQPPILIPYDGHTHTLEATLPEGVRVRLNSITCGCGNDFVRSLRLSLQDVVGSAGGFTAAFQEVCTLSTPLCHALETDEELTRSVGFAVQYLTAANFAAGLLTEANYSRYTLLEPKLLDSLGAQWTQKAEEHLLYLGSPSGLARVAHPCYVCSPAAWHPTKQRIS